MNKKTLVQLLCLFLIMILLLSMFTIKPKVINVSADTVETTALSSVVIEQNSKRILSEKDCNKQLPMASTTKIMTALIALENCKDLDEIFDIDNRASGIKGTSIYLQKNEHLNMRELLYGLMLASGNDAACAIAYKIGNGSMETFVNMMNDKAKELNLNNTHFENPHGLDAENHYTSAYDLAVVTAKAMENVNFREIVNTKVKQISGNDKVDCRFVRNKHKLVGVMEGCNGVKTGFTDNARRCCVTSVTRQDTTLICVVLNCQDMFNESEKMIEDCFKTYNYECVLKPYYMLNNIKVENGTKEEVKIYSQNACYYPLKLEEKDKISYEVDVPQIIEAPIKENQIIGRLKVYFDNHLIFCENIYTMEDIDEKGVLDNIKDIVEKWYYGNI